MTATDTHPPYAIPADAPASRMNAAWWDAFLVRNRNFTDTIVVEDALTEAQTGRFERYVLDVVRKLCGQAIPAGERFRVYIHDRKVTEPEKPAVVFPRVPYEGEAAADWAERTYGRDPFCMIINDAEYLSEPLAQLLSTLLAPLTDKVGIPLNGLHTTTFIGNYGYTPLGIHQDSPGGNVIHFHLGPGTKVMYNWEADAYHALTGTRHNNKDVAPLLPLARQFHFGRGDIYYMPWNKFHIGYSGEFSIGITVWFDNHANDVVLGKLLDKVKTKYLAAGPAAAPRRQPGGPAGEWQALETVLARTPRLAEMPLPALLEEVYKDHMLALFSNGGWKENAPPREHPLKHDRPEAVAHLLSRRVRTVTPFRIHYRVLPDGLIKIFARGTEMQTEYHPQLVEVLDQLNAAEAVPAAHLLADVPDGLRPKLTRLLLNLYNRRAVDLC
jgi:hypothetical protein